MLLRYKNVAVLNQSAQKHWHLNKFVKHFAVQHGSRHRHDNLMLCSVLSLYEADKMMISAESVL